MSQPNDARPDNSQPSVAAQGWLRNELLVRGLYDWLPLAEIDSVIIDNHLAENVPAQQDLALKTIRSLAEDGLMEIGDLPSKGPRLDAWNVTLDEALKRISERFIGHYDDVPAWGYSTWLGLTDAGERVARELDGEAAD